MWVPIHRCPSFATLKKKKGMNGEEEEEEDNGGFLLSKPKTEQLNNENIFMNRLEIGHSSMQGYRRNMEDAHIIDAMESLPDHTLLAVLDGHAGDGTSTYASLRFTEVIEETSQWKQYAALSQEERTKDDAIRVLQQAMVQAYVDMDEELNSSDFLDSSGSTAVSCIITPTHILCANVGDSRCVIGTKNGLAINMSEDHKPSSPVEKKRIIAANGFVYMDRVNGELAMSRALGDFQYKQSNELNTAEQMVTCYPEIAVHIRDKEMDKFVVLACDGVWDVMSNAEAISYLVTIVPATASENTAESMAYSLIDLALNLNSTDNLSAIVVRLNEHSPLDKEEIKEDINEKDSSKKNKKINTTGDDKKSKKSKK
jgi:serine/threonine protein phosphatase PrpC